MLSRQTTENALKEWRTGSTQAEYLCARILVLERFEDIDPQHPLGGPDGKKDIVCTKNRRKYVAAVFFPPTEQTETALLRKYESDLGGVKANDAYGIIFMTNQRTTDAQRKTFEDRASAEGAVCIVYNLEKLKLLLDTPAGYGLRGEFLSIPMTQEEQIAFFGVLASKMSEEFQQQRRSMDELIKSFSEVAAPISLLVGTISELGENVLPKPLTETVATTILTLHDVAGIVPVSSRLDINLIKFAHRAVCMEIAPTGEVGSFRRVQVWIGTLGASIDTARYVPPPPQEIADRLAVLLARWNANFDLTVAKSLELKAGAIAGFHHEFVSIHPFIDGNGRVARILMLQQACDLVGERESLRIDDRAQYFRALQSADVGDFSLLNSLVYDVLRA